MIALNDRMATLAPDDAAPLRTESQKQAARLNGAKSRGPTSAEGRAKSSRNSLRHGLLAAKLAPPSDYRGEDKFYRRLRKELHDEFQPCTFSEHTLVETLAHDHLRLARCRQLIENAMRPRPLKNHDLTCWKRAERIRRDLRALERAQQQLDDNEPLKLPKKHAVRAAVVVEELLEQIELELTETAEAEIEMEAPSAIDESTTLPPLADEATDDHECEEERELSRLLAVLGDRGRKRLRDRDYVTAVLEGENTPKPGDRGRLQAIIVHTTAHQRQWLGWYEREVEPAAIDLAEQSLARLAESPEQLLLLERYTREIEAMIARKIRSLTGA